MSSKKNGGYLQNLILTFWDTEEAVYKIHGKIMVACLPYYGMQHLHYMCVSASFYLQKEKYLLRHL